MYRVPAPARRGRVLPVRAAAAVAALVLLTLVAPAVMAQHGSAPPAHRGGGEANLVLPPLDQGRGLLTVGLGVCVLGLLFGLVMMRRVKAMPVHRSLADISALIYETCKTYLFQQGKLLLVLELFIAAIISIGWLIAYESWRGRTAGLDDPHDDGAQL